MTSVRNDTETTVCGQCGAGFTAVGRRRWCSDACRQSAWRRRRAAPRPTQPAKIDTVYECPQCQTRYLGTQRCEDCNTWSARAEAAARFSATTSRRFARSSPLGKYFPLSPSGKSEL